MLTVALTIPVIAGLFSRRPGVPEALCAIGAGTTALIAADMLLESVPGSLLNPVTLGLALSSVGFGAAYLARRAMVRP
jgi:ABC-type enterobactin transport system permease subunit